MSKVIKMMLARFQAAADYEQDTRKEMRNDFEFYVGEQWPPKIKKDRDSDSRPCLTINRLPQFVRQVTNNQRMNRPSIKIIPTHDGDVDTAGVIEGMIRHIQEVSQASIAYDTACQNQVISGLGYFRIVTEYCNDNSFDQDIKIKRIKNPLTVYFDPACVEPDYSDAHFAFIVADLSQEEFKQQYPKAQSTVDDTFTTIGDEKIQWTGKDVMRVAEYFTVEERSIKLYQLEDGSVVNKLPEGAVAVKERDSSERKVIWRLVTAFEVLDEKEWPGKYIPIVPVLGDDLDVNGKRFLKGMIRDAKDTQRQYNYWASAQTEAIALAPKAPFIAAEGQIDDYKQIWTTANTKNYAYLPYKPTSIDGALVAAPHRQTAEPPVGAMVQAMGQAAEDLKAITGIYDASLGQRSNETSGKAIAARQRQGDVANYHFEDNLARGMNYAGVILLDLFPKIYDTARIVRICAIDGSSKQVQINSPTVMDGVEKIFDVTTMKYDVVIEIGASYATKRQEAAESMTMIAQANPEIWKVAGDLIVKNLDWPGAQELGERLMPDQFKNKDMPPQAKQQLDEAHQMIEQLTGKVNELMDEKDSDLVQIESKERIEFKRMENALVLEQMKLEGKANHELLMAEFSSINNRLSLLDINKPLDNENQDDNMNIENSALPNQGLAQ